MTTPLQDAALATLDAASREVFATITPADTLDDSILLAARARYAELRQFLNVLSGKPLDVHPRLQPLLRAVADVLENVETAMDADIDEDLSDDQLEEVLRSREEAAHWLTQASIAGMCMLTHLNTAMGHVAPSNPTPA